MATTTLAQYRTRVAAKLGLENTSGGDQTLIDSWVNEGYEQFLLDTHCKVQTTSFSLTSQDHTLSSDYLAITELTITSGGDDYGFQRTTAQDILRMRRASPATDSPARWYALEGSDLLRVYPAPSGTDTVNISYVARPTALSASSDSPSDVQAEFHKALEYYALAEGGDYDDDQSSAQGQRYRDLYDQMVAKCLRANLNKGGRRLAPAVVNPSRRMYARHSNDVYP